MNQGFYNTPVSLLFLSHVHSSSFLQKRLCTRTSTLTKIKRLLQGCSSVAATYAAIKYVCNNWWRQNSQLERLVACLQQPCSFYQRLQAHRATTRSQLQIAAVTSKKTAKTHSLLYKETNIKSMQVGTRSQLQLAAVCSKEAAAVCSKQAATVCRKQAATKSEKSNLHMKNAQAARLQQTMSRKVAATKSRKIAATKSRKVAATKSSKTNLHTKNSQVATMPQLAAAA